MKKKLHDTKRLYPTKKELTERKIVLPIFAAPFLASQEAGLIWSWWLSFSAIKKKLHDTKRVSPTKKEPTERKNVFLIFDAPEFSVFNCNISPNKETEKRG